VKDPKHAGRERREAFFPFGGGRGSSRPGGASRCFD